MRDEAAGKTFTLREFAEKMISVSDNTATDHLLAFVGRQAVEETVKASGNAAAARNVPFLSTRDVFALKLLWLAGRAARLRGRRRPPPAKAPRRLRAARFASALFSPGQERVE